MDIRCFLLSICENGGGDCDRCLLQKLSTPAVSHFLGFLSMSIRIVGPLLATALLAPCFSAAIAQDRPALVQVDKVRTEPLNQTRPVLGRIVTKQQGEVAAAIAGRVANVLVDVGDRIESGAPIVELDAEPVQFALDLVNAEYETAEADRDTSKAEIELLENELVRLNRLKQSAAFSKAQLEDKGPRDYRCQESTECGNRQAWPIPGQAACECQGP